MPKLTAPLVATLTGDAHRVQEDVWKGVVFTQRGHSRAYIKLLNKRKLVVECLAAMLGRAHDLPIPAPFIVRVSGHQLEGFVGSYEGWAFGSEESEAPSLERITRDPEEVARLLRKWPRANDGAAFDAWIGNGDRTAKNILWSDTSNFVGLIDHDDAFPDWLAPDGELVNGILTLLCEGIDEVSRQRHRKSTIKSTEKYPRTDWTTAAGLPNVLDLQEQVDGLVNFLKSRMQHLPKLITIAAGTKQQELDYVSR